MTNYSLNRKSVTIIGGMALAILLSSQASAQITYDGSITIAGHSSNYSITTDGTFGSLTSSNIAAWSIEMSAPGGVVTFGGPFGSIGFVGSSLSATSTDLLFNYDLLGANYIQFCSFNCRHSLLFEASDDVADRNGMRFDNGAFVFAPQTGVQSIASVPGDPIGAVPEPSTWATMLLGFGAIGFSVRRRRKAVGIAQLA